MPPPTRSQQPNRAIAMRPSLLTKVQAALQQVEPLAARGWGPAESIARQLRWCAAFAADEEREERPGPFSMGLIATREFDMYGDRPELASLINEVQRETEQGLKQRPKRPACATQPGTALRGGLLAALVNWLWLHRR